MIIVFVIINMMYSQATTIFFDVLALLHSAQLAGKIVSFSYLFFQNFIELCAVWFIGYATSPVVVQLSKPSFVWSWILSVIFSETGLHLCLYFWVAEAFLPRCSDSFNALRGWFSSPECTSHFLAMFWARSSGAPSITASLRTKVMFSSCNFTKLLVAFLSAVLTRQPFSFSFAHISPKKMSPAWRRCCCQTGISLTRWETRQRKSRLLILPV